MSEALDLVRGFLESEGIAVGPMMILESGSVLAYIARERIVPIPPKHPYFKAGGYLITVHELDVFFCKEVGRFIIPADEVLNLTDPASFQSIKRICSDGDVDGPIRNRSGLLQK